MKSFSLGSLHLPSADAKRNAEPKGYSFDDSRHPVLAIANGIAVFFLVMSALAFLALMTDAFLTRT